MEIESGTYRFESEVNVDTLPNTKGFINLGKGKLTMILMVLFWKANMREPRIRLHLTQNHCIPAILNIIILANMVTV